MALTRTAVLDYARQLDDTPWQTVLGYAWAMFITLALALLVTPVQWREPVRALGLALPLMLLVAKDLAQLPAMPARLRALRGRRAGLLAWLAACLPPGLVGLMRLDRALWGAFFCWLRRQPRPARPAGVALSFDKQGAYSAVVAFGLLSVFVEIPIDAAILPLLVRDHDLVRVIHIVVAVSAAYSLVWLMADRWLVRGNHHVLTDTHLDLQIGVRASACIPLAEIEHAEVLRQPVQEWRRAHPFRATEAVRITPFDKPNLVLRLRQDAACTITHHGCARTGVRYVFLYLDRPERLVAGLAPAPGAAAADLLDKP